MTKKVAIVILNWNGRKLLEQFLPSVCKNTSAELADIIVADNASDDDSRSFLKQEYPSVGLISLDTNYGFAGGYNRALTGLDYEYFVLLNSDVEVAENWLEPLVDYLDAHPDTAAAQPKIRSFRNKELFEYAGASGGFIDKLGYPFCRGRIQQSIETDLGQYDEVRTVFWASGACLFIRSKDFFALEGFDENFFAHQEEIDLCWRLASRQRKVVCIPSSTVYHLGAATLEKESPRKTFLNFRNNRLMLYKNLPESDLKRVLLVRFWLDILAAFVFLLKGQVRNFNAVLIAMRAFVELKRKYKLIRAREQAASSTADPSLFYSKSIIADYFFRGKKRFSELDY